MPDTAEELAARWREAKQREDAAKDERYEIEQQMLAIHKARPEGTRTVALANGVQMKLIQKMAYKVDFPKLETLTKDWPADSRPFKTQQVADEQMLRHIRLEMPRLWNQIADAIEVKPNKVSFAFKWGDEA